MKIKKIVLALLATGLSAGFLTSAYADDAARIKALEDQLQVLQKAIAELKASTPSKQEISELTDQVNLQGKDAVVLGDMANSFRMPGSDTSVRVYGYAEANLIKDFKGTAPGDMFTNLPEQPLNGSNPAKGKTVLTGQTSRFGFETSTPTALGPVHTVVEGDFYAYVGSENNRNRFRLRQAYGEYAGWLIGQTWSTFMDLNDGPETADFNGPIGMPFSRPVQIRYTYNTPTGLSFQAALENPSDGAQRPNLVLAVSKSYDNGAGANLRLISHEQRIGNLSKNGSGFGFGGSYKLTSDLTLMGQYAAVDADDGNIMYGANYPDISTGAMLLDKSRGYVLGLTNVFSPKLRATLAYGYVQSQYNATDAYALATGGNKSLSQLHLNFFYTPIKNVDLGAELIGGVRKTFAGETGDMSRVNLLARYSFN
jgi:type II secretory pathway pseudopilin PulG